MDTNLAVLIDFENIAAGTDKEGLGRFDVNAIMSRLVEKGRILIARSYADWGRFSRFKQALLAANVTMYELTSHGMQDKNRADIAMVVDALELAFTKDYVDTFVIVSGDSDFTPLVLKMRELNKRVIGIGTRSSTSRLLVQACDEFIFYDSIVKSKRKRNTRSTGKKGGRQQAYDLLVDALQGLQRENPQAPLASRVKGAMRRKSPDFSESELGYPSFARFLEAARDAGYISLERDRKAGGYRVDSVDGVDTSDDDSDDTENKGGEWVDPYMPEGVNVWTDALGEQGFDMLSYPVRMQVLEHIEGTVDERRKKRRKVNAQFVREDVRKRLRKTFPELPTRAIRSLFTAMMQAGLLIHKDGTAIRSASAAFHLEKDAAGLNKVLVSHYLAHLEEANADLHDVDRLSHLLLGDAARRREIEEALAWLAQTQMGAGDEAELNDIDLDDLLVAEPAKGQAKSEPKSEDTPEAEPTAEAPPEEAKEAATADDSSATEATEEPAPEEPAPEKPAPKKRTRRTTKTTKSTTAKTPAKRTTTRKSTKKTEAPAEEASTEASDTTDEPAAEEAPKKRTRRRVRRKKPETTESEDGNDLDLDALLE